MKNIIILLGVLIMGNIIVHYGQDALDHLNYKRPFRAVDAIKSQEGGARFTPSETAYLSVGQQQIPSSLLEKVRVHVRDTQDTRQETASKNQAWYETQAGTGEKREGTSTGAVGSAKDKGGSDPVPRTPKTRPLSQIVN